MKEIIFGLSGVVLFFVWMYFSGLYFDRETWCGTYLYNKIKFQSFLKFYYINPDAWYLSDSYVEYIENDARFEFSQLDFVKYHRWKTQLDNKKITREHTVKYQETLECIKRDLEEFNRKNGQMIKKEAEKMAKQATDIPSMFVDEIHPVHAYYQAKPSYIKENLENVHINYEIKRIDSK